jgi:hypothetical protein
MNLVFRSSQGAADFKLTVPAFNPVVKSRADTGLASSATAAANKEIFLNMTSSFCLGLYNLAP